MTFRKLLTLHEPKLLKSDFVACISKEAVEFSWWWNSKIARRKNISASPNKHWISLLMLSIFDWQLNIVPIIDKMVLQSIRIALNNNIEDFSCVVTPSKIAFSTLTISCWRCCESPYQAHVNDWNIRHPIQGGFLLFKAIYQSINLPFSFDHWC